MKLRLSFALGCLIWVLQPAFAQSAPTPVGLAELLRSPENHDRQLVKVEGFLHIEREKPRGIVSAFLYLNDDDIDQHPPLNSIVVVASKSMMRDRVKLERHQVAIIGVFRTVSRAGGTYTSALKDIRTCIPILRQD